MIDNVRFVCMIVIFPVTGSGEYVSLIALRREREFMGRKSFCAITSDVRAQRFIVEIVLMNADVWRETSDDDDPCP